MKTNLTIFDLDGTILNSSHTLCESYRNFFKSNYNLDVSFYDLYPILHKPYQVVLEKFAAVDEHDIQAFENELKSRKNYNVELFPYTREVLEYLSEFSYLSTATNMSESFAREIIERFRLNDYFDLILGLNNRMRGKPNPDMLFEAMDTFEVNAKSVYFVGDSNSDMKAGRNASVNTIFIKHYQNLSNNRSLIDYYIDQLDELKNIIKRDL